MKVHKRESVGIVAAVATPVRDGLFSSIDLKQHVRQLAVDGCNGILLLGTTGEGPSFSLDERMAILEVGCKYAGDMVVMAGTGCANLPDTIKLTRHAFEIGVDAVVVIPPFYFKSVSDEGLLSYYLELIEEAVPDDGRLLLYHIPQVTGVPISFALLENLLARAGTRTLGIKDSSGEISHSYQLCQRFPNLQVFLGDDKLLHQGLQFGASGCITAGTNVMAPLAANVYRAFNNGRDAEIHQEQLTAARLVLDEFKPFPSSIKGLLSVRYGTSGWELRAPLTPMREAELTLLIERLLSLNLNEQCFDWLISDKDMRLR